MSRLLKRLRNLGREGAERSENQGIVLGRYTYGSPTVKRYSGDTEDVVVGAFVSIADDVMFVPGGNHRTDWVSSFPFRARLELDGAFADGHPASKGAIVIGNDVWIARGATILSGVQIGNGAVVGAGAIVSKDVRPYAVVAGNPAREVKRRFSEEQIDALERIAWWSWPDDVIRNRVPELNGWTVDHFIEKYDSTIKP
jgi:acetyltransferase-like isoleucine patch superfamily enzyme